MILIEKFKYFRSQCISKLRLVEWRKVFTTFLLWIIDVVVEGLTVNFATHFLFGWKFTFFTFLAYGILIDKTFSFYRQFREKI